MMERRAKKPNITKVWVDADRCLANRHCVREAPEIFEVVDAQYEMGLQAGHVGRLTPEYENLLCAASVCPVSAIKLELQDGRVLDGDSRVLKSLIKGTS